MTLNVRIVISFVYLRHAMKFMNYKYLATISSATMAIALSGCASVPTHPITQQIDQDMVFVEGGTFTMGSNSPLAKKAEKPAR